MVVVRLVGAGPRSSSGLKQFFPSIASVVNLDVAREDFGQVLEPPRPMIILGVDEQVVFIRKRLAWPGIDRVCPADDFRLVGWSAVGIGCGGLFHRVHQAAIFRAGGCIDFSVVAELLRRGLREIQATEERKLAASDRSVDVLQPAQQSWLAWCRHHVGWPCPGLIGPGYNHRRNPYPRSQHETRKS